jgi:protein SCO1/2
MESKYSLKHGLVAALSIACLVFLGIRVMNSRPTDLFQKPQALAPEFSLTDRSGQTLSKTDLAGKVWVADFIFTRCAGTCPMQGGRMGEMQKEWKGNPGFKLVSFTVDPKRDTVSALRKYAENIGALEDQWFFLTGEKKKLYQIIGEGFLVTAKEDLEGEAGFEFIHTTRMVLVDGKGFVRGFYDAQKDEEMKKLRQDIKFLMSMKGKS